MLGASRERKSVGVAAVILGTACLAGMDASAKWLSQHYPIVEVVFFRNLLALVPVLVAVAFCGGLSALRMQNIPLQLARGACILGAMAFFFSALRDLPLADATALGFTAPLFVVLLSAPLLSERVSVGVWVSVILGFLGVLLINIEGLGAFQPAQLLPLGKALCFGLVLLLTRRMRHTETRASLIFWGTVIPLFGVAAAVPAVWIPPAMSHWPVLLTLGLLGGLSTVCLVVAYANAPAATLAPFDYTAIIWASSIGWLVWEDFPTAAVWGGTLLIVIACLYISSRKQDVAVEA